MAECIKRESALRVTHIMRPEDEDLKSAISNIPAADVAPIEALERLRDELCAQELITMRGLRRLNTLIWKYTTVHDGGQSNDR